MVQLVIFKRHKRKVLATLEYVKLGFNSWRNKASFYEDFTKWTCAHPLTMNEVWIHLPI